MYPDKLRSRVHQLYNIEQTTMTDTLAILKHEFPELSNRMNRDRLHSVARMLRLKHGTAPNHPKMANNRKGKRQMSPDIRKELIDAARKLRKKNYRWQAVKAELQLQFPNIKIPTTKTLYNLVRGIKRKTTDTLKQYHISITSPSGSAVNMTVLSSKGVEKIIQYILEV